MASVKSQLEHYVRCAIPEPYTVLGVRLKHFCLGHYFLMKRFDCRFSYEEMTAASAMSLVNELLFAVAICGRSFDDFLEFIASADAQDWFQKWLKILDKACRDQSYNVLEQFSVFSEYIQESMEEPAYAINKNDGDEMPGAHWTHSLYTFLQGRMSVKEAMNYPFKQGIADWCKYLEDKGAITFLSDSLPTNIV